MDGIKVQQLGQFSVDAVLGASDSNGKEKGQSWTAVQALQEGLKRFDLGSQLLLALPVHLAELSAKSGECIRGRTEANGRGDSRRQDS